MRWGRMGGWPTALASVLVASYATSAAADTADDELRCVATEQRAQRAREAGRLSEARAEFLACSKCGGSVAEDCARSAGEVLAATPTVVIEAKDEVGQAVGDASVTIDGQLVAKELDGKAIPVDPGSHTIVLERPLAPKATHAPRVSQTFVATEGVKARPIPLTFPGGYDENAPARDIAGHTVWPWAVASIGAVVTVVGGALVLTAPALPAACDSGSATCRGVEPGRTLSRVNQDTKQAGEHRGQILSGAITIGGGLGILAAGLVWHFLEPTRPRSSGIGSRITPWVMPGAGGLSARAEY